MARVLSVSVVAAALVIAVLALAGVFGGDDGDGTRLGSLSVGGDVAGAADLSSDRINEIYNRVKDGVVFIQATQPAEIAAPFGAPGENRGVATGTGFAIDERTIVTNAHVVAGAEEVAIRLGPNRLLPAELVGTDLTTDLAVLRVDAGDADLDVLQLGDMEGVRVGDSVLAIGNPFGLEDTVTSGIVSALQRSIVAPNGFPIDEAIQVDAPINPGNSGGPLLNADGRVIGVNSQIAAGPEDRSSAGIGFAVPVSVVKRVVPDLLEDGEVDRPFLGVSTVELTPQLAEQLGIDAEQGALVTTVAPRSPAAEAGIRSASGAVEGALTGEGDVILSVAGEAVTGPDSLFRILNRFEPGDQVDVTVLRDGERRTLELELTQRPSAEQP